MRKNQNKKFSPETQAMVIPPSSLSENRNKNVPHGHVASISSACFFFTKPIIALQSIKTNINLHTILSIFNAYPSTQGPRKCSLVNFIIAKNHSQNVKFLSLNGSLQNCAQLNNELVSL